MVFCPSRDCNSGPANGLSVLSVARDRKCPASHWIFICISLIKYTSGNEWYPTKYYSNESTVAIKLWRIISQLCRFRWERSIGFTCRSACISISYSISVVFRGSDIDHASMRGPSSLVTVLNALVIRGWDNIQRYQTQITIIIITTAIGLPPSGGSPTLVQTKIKK
jgi:hypothetical protein